MSPRDQSVCDCMAESTTNVKDISPHYKKDIKRKSEENSIRQIRKITHENCQCCDTARTNDYLCTKDFYVQSRNLELLLQTTWYFEGMSSQQAKQTLSKSEVGTFLVRDSSDPNFLFSVSVKTPRGPTSVRVSYCKGLFQLDCDVHIKSTVPKFDSLVALVDYYVRLGLNEKHKCRWLESSGRKDLPIVLKKPKTNGMSDLRHLCRLTINRNLPVTQKQHEIVGNIDKLGLPKPLAEYLKYYPHLN